MIVPHDNDAAWFAPAEGQPVPFDSGRLEGSIRSAAARAGHYDWWLAESIAAAVHLYATENAPQRTVAAGEVTAIVEALLERLGHSDVARAYSGRLELADIWLDEVAARAAGGFELGFYRQLDHALTVAAEDQTRTVRVMGLRSCVMQLRGDRRWSAGSRRFADEIVEYVRDRVVQLRPTQAAALDLAVLE